MKLQDRVAIVTGGAQGIGQAVAQKLADEGATIVVADANGTGAEKAAADLAGALGLQVDVSQPGEVQAMVDETVGRFGRLDVLVNNAAITGGAFAAWDEIDFVEWRRIMAVNLDGIFLTVKAAERPMRAAGYGRIVNMASNSVLAAPPDLAHYVASKGGVLAFTRVLARELGAHGITVNAVAPGLTATEGVLASGRTETFEIGNPSFATCVGSRPIRTRSQ
jgi:pyridoxal 4-dehydrogenase